MKMFFIIEEAKETILLSEKKVILLIAISLSNLIFISIK